MKSLINIDCDLVRIFRLEGRPDLARMVWKTYRRDLKNQGKQAARDYGKHNYMKHKVKGICANNCCFNKPVPNFVYCKKHQIIRQRSYRLWNFGISYKTARSFRLMFG